MKKLQSTLSLKGWLLLPITIIIYLSSATQADRPGWQREEVHWRLTGGNSIKAIYYPTAKPTPLRNSQAGYITHLQKKSIIRQPTFELAHAESESDTLRFSTLGPESPPHTIAYVIDSPPIDGFTPWVVVSVTDERLGDLELNAVLETSVVGRYPRGVNPQTDYAIGILDTGASAHVMGYVSATQAGLFNSNFITSNMSLVAGVIGTVDAWVSQPLAIFVDSLSVLEPDGLLLDTSRMLGQSNVAIVVGQNPGSRPDLPTAIGTPLSVFFTTVIDNDREVTVIRNNEKFTGPDVHLYQHEDSCIPVYSNIVPLELRPAGAIAVQYIPSLEGFLEFPPQSPSVIISNLSQSLLFVHSVDLVEGENIALDKDRFMLDTGAQVSVIGSRIAARLRLNPDKPEFEVEIQDVTGQIILAPGFYIDSIQIPAIGEWLSYTNVPVIFLDAFSPEGGTFDGIIGMNLFVNFNLVLRGGGMFLQDEPALYFEPVAALIADIAPEEGDGRVDGLDFTVLANAWLSVEGSGNWNPKADIAPQPIPDGQVTLLDLKLFAQCWLEASAP